MEKELTNNKSNNKLLYTTNSSCNNNEEYGIVFKNSGFGEATISKDSVKEICDTLKYVSLPAGAVLIAKIVCDTIKSSS